jgi:hypothetical protein
MTRLAAAAKDVLGPLGDLYFFRRFKALCARAEGGLLLVDIDNTIAATHAFESASPGRRIRVEALEPVPAVAAWLEREAPGRTIAYLSARNLWTWRRTAQWLRRHAFPDGELILVATPERKLGYLRHACPLVPVTLIDDLSYLGPDGALGFHDDVIRRIRELDLIYLGHDDIAAIVAGAAG